jgi:hypothetical protein
LMMMKFLSDALLEIKEVYRCKLLYCINLILIDIKRDR